MVAITTVASSRPSTDVDIRCSAAGGVAAFSALPWRMLMCRELVVVLREVDRLVASALLWRRRRSDGRRSDVRT